MVTEKLYKVTVLYEDYYIKAQDCESALSDVLQVLARTGNIMLPYRGPGEVKQIELKDMLNEQLRHEDILI